MTDKLVKYIREEVKGTKEKEQLKDVIWGSIYDLNMKYDKKTSPLIKIVILNAPCNGFGDLIFAKKLCDFLLEWYNCEVTIVTTLDKSLLSLGVDPKYVLGFSNKNEKSSAGMQCRRFANLKINGNLPEQDLIFIGPMQIDYTPVLKDVKKLLPYSTLLNTFFFSEYNDSMDKKFDINTGVDNGRDGVFITKIPKNSILPRSSKLPNKYAVVYVAESITRVKTCISSFINLLVTKYKNIKNFDLVVPSWYSPSKDIISHIGKRWDMVVLVKNVNKEKKTVVLKDGKNTSIFTFRCDIFPVPNPEMISIMKHSVDDILLTGDQSISDALSCCSNKNIFYQIAPWKEDFGKKLAKELPNHYLSKKKSSCGTMTAYRYKSDYKKFLKKWDFKRQGKPKLDSIVMSVILEKNVKEIGDIAKIINSKSSLATIQKKID